MSQNQRTHIGAGFHQPYFPQPFHQGQNASILGNPNTNSIPVPNLPNRPNNSTAIGSGNTAIRSRFRLPFDPTTTSSLPIYFFDPQLQEFVIPTTGRDQNPYGYLTVFGATTFKHLEVLWKYRKECLEFIEERGLEKDIPRYGGSKSFEQTSRRDGPTNTSTNSTSSSEKEKLTGLLASLGFKSQLPPQPTEEDKLKNSLLNALKDLGYELPADSVAPQDPLDIRIRELEARLAARNAEIAKPKATPKPIDPRERKLAELTALLSGGNNTQSSSSSVEPSEDLEAAFSTIQSQESTIAQLQKLLGNQDEIIKSQDQKGKKVSDSHSKLLSLQKTIRERDQKIAAQEAEIKARTATVLLSDADDDLAGDDTDFADSASIASSAPKTPARSQSATPAKKSRRSPISAARATTAIAPPTPPASTFASCKKLIEHINRRCKNSDTMMDAAAIAASLALFDSNNLRAFYKHFNVTDINNNDRHIASKSNVSKAITVLKAKCLIALD